MRLVNVLALTNAKLINDPFVSNFTNLVFEAKAVKRGDLFIAFDEENIEDAIANGAYGVIFDKPTQISDNEIAWIKVANIKEALKKLLRFKLIEKEILNYSCDEITLKFALQINSEPKLLIINKSLRKIAQNLWNIEKNSITLFSKKFQDIDIFTDINSLTQSDTQYIQVLEKTLFETSFIYEKKYYDREFISPLFISKINDLINLYKKLHIDFRLRKFSTIENFEPIFINKKLEIKEFGSTDRVLIFEKDLEFISQEIEFLKKNSAWAKTIYILPSSYHNIDEENDNVYRYKKSKEILQILQKNNFNFALIVGADRSIISKPISIQTQLTLNF